jgi:enoyl-CoA hydratase
MEAKWRLILYAGSLVRTPRQMPYCNAMELLLTGARIDAHEARRPGHINYADLFPRVYEASNSREVSIDRRVVAQVCPFGVQTAVRPLPPLDGGWPRSTSPIPY